MPLNKVKLGKFLLAVGLLAVLVQGLIEVPELQDYLFPDQYLGRMRRSAKKVCERIEEELPALGARLVYLAWVQANKSKDLKVSWGRLVSFPFSESIRRWSPDFFLDFNFFLAKKSKVNVERKLRYFDALMYHIDANTKKIPPSAMQFSWINPLEQNKELHRLMLLYEQALNDLSGQLTLLENTMQNK
jgi:hypothetical protein